MKPIFLSHCSNDKEVVIRLRQALEEQKLSVWIDSRNLRAGQTLTDELKNAIQEAGAFFIVLSLEVFNSPWVMEELQWALAKQKQDLEFPVIPLMLPGFELGALRNMFSQEPLAIRIPHHGPDGVDQAISEILAALQQGLPDDPQPPEEIVPDPLEELQLELKFPEIKESEGKRRPTAMAELVYIPGNVKKESGGYADLGITAKL